MSDPNTPGSPRVDDRRAYLIKDLPLDLVEAMLAQAIPDDLPDYDPYEPAAASHEGPDAPLSRHR